MSITITFAWVLMSAAGAPSISGQVLDGSGRPVVGARVFIEQGLSGALTEIRTDGRGTFRFDGLSPGPTGLFAIADQFAFGGRHINLSLADTVEGAVLRLGPPGEIQGRVLNEEGKAVEGARITRVAILGLEPVGIPLAKLRALGFSEPQSGEDGRFRIEHLPKGASVALKIVHPAYAQEGSKEIAVGAKDAQIVLSPGVLLSGSVVSRTAQAPVPQAVIHIRNAVPPYDTSVIRAEPDGTFAVRLKPGAYVYQAESAVQRTGGWQPLRVMPGTLTQYETLYVAGAGRIQGQVRDARSGAPIAGARVRLDVSGNPAALTVTGPTGEYAFDAAEGDNVVVLEPVSGYFDPPTRAMAVHITQGSALDVPTFWLAPVPRFVLRILGPNDQPAPRALVRVIRPAQLGWHVADEEGRVELHFASLPDDWRVVGIAESADGASGAFFEATKKTDADAVVLLAPWARVSGRAVLPTGAPRVGVVVEARYTDAALPETLVLWRTVTDAEGRFAWDSVLPHVPQYLAGGDGAVNAVEYKSFLVAAGETADLGDMVLGGGANPGKSLKGSTLAWDENPVLCGELPDKRTLRRRAAVILYAEPLDVPILLDALAVLQDRLNLEKITFAVLTGAPIACGPLKFPVLQALAPADATTYLIDPRGQVVLETFGLPPIEAVRKLTE